jgi:hypothetical protein
MSRTRTITTVVVALALAAPGVAAAQHDLRSPDARDGWPQPASKSIDRVSPDARDGWPQRSSTSIDRVSPDARYGVPDGSTPAPVMTIPRTRVVEIEQTGFKWGDAAIGGAAAVALFLTAGALVLTVRPRRSAATH